MIGERILWDINGIKQSWGKRVDVLSVGIDNRRIAPGELFIALKGERFDGFDFIAGALERECSGVAFTWSPSRVKVIEFWQKQYPNVFFIGVEDSLKYLQALGQAYLDSWKLLGNKQVIGITGSNGKTTTKEMLCALLQVVAPGQVHSTQGNFNNHIGVPLTLLGLRPEHNWAIVELGSNHPGEIEQLCQLSRPDLGIITNIGKSHLEFFKTQENVFKEKRALYDFVMTNGQRKRRFIINGDDLFLNQLNPDDRSIHFGQQGTNVSISFDVAQVKIKYENGTCCVIKNVNISGQHNFYNLVSCFLLANELFPAQSNKLLAAATTFCPRNNRSLWIADGDQRYFLDAYNANPSSMQAALTSFLEEVRRQNGKMDDVFFILGDMNELGDLAGQYHREIGQFLRQSGVIKVAFIGKYANDYRLGFAGECLLFDNRAKFDARWHEIKNKYRYFFIKGSRTLQLESLVNIS